MKSEQWIVRKTSRERIFQAEKTTYVKAKRPGRAGIFWDPFIVWNVWLGRAREGTEQVSREQFIYYDGEFGICH